LVRTRRALADFALFGGLAFFAFSMRFGFASLVGLLALVGRRGLLDFAPVDRAGFRAELDFESFDGFVRFFALIAVTLSDPNVQVLAAAAMISPLMRPVHERE